MLVLVPGVPYTKATRLILHSFPKTTHELIFKKHFICWNCGRSEELSHCSWMSPDVHYGNRIQEGTSIAQLAEPHSTASPYHCGMRAREPKSPSSISQLLCSVGTWISDGLAQCDQLSCMWFWGKKGQSGCNSGQMVQVGNFTWLFVSLERVCTPAAAGCMVGPSATEVAVRHTQ